MRPAITFLSCYPKKQALMMDNKKYKILFINFVKHILKSKLSKFKQPDLSQKLTYFA